MPKSYGDDVRFACKRLYCLQRKTLDEIEQMKPPAISTLRRWRSEGKWDDQRVKQSLSGPMLAQAIMQQINQIIQRATDEGRILTKAESDQVVKLQKVASQHDKNARFTSHAIETVDQLNSWLGSHYPDLRKRMVTPLMEFSRYVTESAAA